MTTRIAVSSAAGSYPIVVGAGSLRSLPRLLARAGLGPRRIAVSSPRVWRLHGASLARATTEPAPILVPDGERFKTTATVARVYDALLRADADRSTVLVAVGGGVIGDMAGFAAATYLRGLRLVHVPTTLMAQVDSAVGGKTGVNHPRGKNLIGAFHAPRLVLADPTVLTTLPHREFRAGLYEVIKYGVIASAPLFDRVATSLPRLLARDPRATAAIVTESCRIKATVVSADEHESGLRRILNFGHTIGHALEAATRYGRLRHGEAVGYGMLAALTLGVRRGVTEAGAAQRVAEVIRRLGPLPPVSDLSLRAVMAALSHDKKVIAGTLHFVAATGIGATAILTDVRASEIKAALRGIGITKA